MTDLLLFEIGTVIIVATVLAYMARLIRQPMILGYILAGFVIGPALSGLITSTETIALLSELGVAFLLFIVGLEIDFNKIKTSGSRTIVIAAGQMLFTAAAGYGIATMFGFSGVNAFYIAAALTFSSTVILIKLLSDKATLDTTHGRLILGMLLVQDAVAILILALLPTLGHTDLQIIGFSLAKGVLMFLATIIAAKTLIPVILNISARSTELLFLSAVSWLFLAAFFADFLGYSVAIGSFLAGVAFASSRYKLEVVSRVKSLRDFFATIFFVSLGMQLVVPSFDTLFAVLALAALAIIGKPAIVAVLGFLTGYNNKTSIMAGLPMGQISEFSLIIIALGLSLGHITTEISSTIIAAAAISITATTYLVNYDSRIYHAIKNLFGLNSVSVKEKSEKTKYDVILCGYNRIGYSISRKLKDLGRSYIIVDFDPDVVSKLKRENIPVIYGDIGNVEFLKTLGIPDAELVISTVPDMHESEMIIEEAKKGSTTAVVTTNQVENALKLYDHGASYVILPHFIGGEHVALLLKKFENMPDLAQHKFTHIRDLHSHKSLGYEHII